MNTRPHVDPELRLEAGIEPIGDNAAYSLAVSARRMADDVHRMADALDEFMVWIKARDARGWGR